MQAEFLVENIEGFLSILSKTLPSHSQIPVLSNLLLEATDKGFFISATNLETGVKVKVPAKIEEEGSVTIPGKQFLEVVSSLPKDKVQISTEKETMSLVSRGNKVVFQTISREEFPTLFEQKGDKIHVFEEGELAAIFSKVIFSVSQDEARPELTGVLVSQKDNRNDLVATDGFRLSLKKIKGSGIFKEEENLIFPSRIISDAMSIKTGKITMYVYKKSNQVIFEADDLTLVGRLINGEFPNYERVIPPSFKTQITADKEEMLQLLKLSSVFARDAANIVRVKVEDGRVKIFARASGLGEGEAVLEAEQEGEDNEIAFNVKFLSDALRNIPGKTITIQLSSPIEPAVFKTDEDQDFLHIIMPVRVQE